MVEHRLASIVTLLTHSWKHTRKRGTTQLSQTHTWLRQDTHTLLIKRLEATLSLIYD